MGTLHLAVNVFALFWKTPRLLKLKNIISFSRGRTLSGHTWSTAKKFLILDLSFLHPYGKPYLGPLLGDGSCCSATHHGGWTMSWIARLWFAPARTSSRWRCTTGTRRSRTIYGGMTPDTHSRPHGLRPQGWPSPQDEALRGTTLLGVSRKTPGRYPKDTTRSVRIRMIT